MVSKRRATEAPARIRKRELSSEVLVRAARESMTREKDVQADGISSGREMEAPQSADRTTRHAPPTAGVPVPAMSRTSTVLRLPLLPAPLSLRPRRVPTHVPRVGPEDADRRSREAGKWIAKA